MPIPTAEQLTGNTVTEAGFKAALSDLVAAVAAHTQDGAAHGAYATTAELEAARAALQAVISTISLTPGPRPEITWQGTSLIIQAADGSYHSPVDLKGSDGASGTRGEVARDGAYSVQIPFSEGVAPRTVLSLNVTPSSPSMGFIIDVSSEFEASGSKQMKISLVRQVGSIESTVAEITGSGGPSVKLQGVFIDRPATSAEVTYFLQAEVLQSHGSASASGGVDHIAAWGII